MNKKMLLRLCDNETYGKSMGIIEWDKTYTRKEHKKLLLHLCSFLFYLNLIKVRVIIRTIGEVKDEK